MNTTQSIFKKGEEYCLKRKQFHEQIIKTNDNLKEGFRLHRELPQKHILMLAGGSGAGKTSALERDTLYDLCYCYNLLDPDSVKEFLPEYYCDGENIRNAPLVHDESSDIVQNMIRDYAKKNRCLVYDSTMKSFEKNIKIVKLLKHRGYLIDIIFIDCDLVLAYSRVKERASKTGRDTPVNVIRDSNYLSAKTVCKILDSHFDLINAISILCSCHSEDTEEDNLKPVYVRTQDNDTIFNELLYAQFRKKALTKEQDFVDTEEMIASIK